MESPIHTINSLFAQLGLDASDEAIASFLAAQDPIPASVALYDGAMWNASQSTFLRESVEDDADWAEVVDQLDALLRGQAQQK